MRAFDVLYVKTFKLIDMVLGTVPCHQTTCNIRLINEKMCKLKLTVFPTKFHGKLENGSITIQAKSLQIHVSVLLVKVLLL